MGFSTEQMGFYLRPESFLVCKDIHAILMERFEEEMMKKRVESEFRGYSIKNSIQTVINALNISNITNDKGDDFSDFPIYDFDKYDYEEESTEPTPAAQDSHAK